MDQFVPSVALHQSVDISGNMLLLGVGSSKAIRANFEESIRRWIMTNWEIIPDEVGYSLYIAREPQSDLICCEIELRINRKTYISSENGPSVESVIVKAVRRIRKVSTEPVSHRAPVGLEVSMAA